VVARKAKQKDNYLVAFKKILIEAAKLYGVPVHEVTQVQWGFVNARRISAQTFRQLGGFARTRGYVAPSPEVKPDKSVRKTLERLLQYTEK
jgi:hypothetical protein